MSQHKILIVEDEHTSARVIQEMILRNGYQADIAENGRIALEMFKVYPYHIVITDLDMPEMGGEELIQHLKTYTPCPVIFVETGHTDPSTIIDIMKMGVYDYIIKPVNTADLSLKIAHAFEAVEIRRIRAISDRERIARLENQLDWYKWQERVKNRDTKNLDKSLFHSLKTSFSQGAGFGSLITIVDLAVSSAQFENNAYLVDKEIFDLLASNVKMAEKALEAFADIDNLNTCEMALESIDYKELHKIITGCTEELSELSHINNNIIRVSDMKQELSTFKLAVNRGYLASSIKELLTNAFKFSEKESDIIIILDRLGEFIEIEILSIPIPNDDGSKGIPLECENLVFEPFFRMTKKLYEAFKTLDFGIGLTFVENVVIKHKGRVSATTITDYSGKEKTGIIRVSIAVFLPIASH
jgi:CheY-like chemotaxis protein